MATTYFFDKVLVMFKELNEKCGVAGGLLYDKDEHVAPYLREILLAEQNRGREASGMVTEQNRNTLNVVKHSGLAKHIFDEKAMTKLLGNIGIGHNRYSTSGSKTDIYLPYDENQIGFAFSHNGNIPDTTKLRSHLAKNRLTHGSPNDSVMMGRAIGQNIRDRLNLPDAVEEAFPFFTGAFSCVAMHDGMLVAFRDKCGMRPLSIGENKLGKFVASETCGLVAATAIDNIKDVQPGEMLILNEDGIESRQLTEPDPALDVFEFIYFARPDSVINGHRVHEVRKNLGEQLAIEQPPRFGEQENTVVMPIPATSRPVANAYAKHLGLEYEEGVFKNEYVDRTFILPSQRERLLELGRKLIAIPEEFNGKHVIFIDDSLVRGNTLPPLIAAAHNYGALSVTCLLSSPPIRFPDFYGIDTPSQSELPAANMSIKNLQQQLGADHLGYLHLSGLKNVLSKMGMNPDHFNYSCFDGKYRIDIGQRVHEVHSPVSMEFAE